MRTDDAVAQANATLDALERELPGLVRVLEAIEPHRVMLAQVVPRVLEASFRGEIDGEHAIALTRRMLALNRTLRTLESHFQATRTLAETPTKGSA